VHLATGDSVFPLPLNKDETQQYRTSGPVWGLRLAGCELRLAGCALRVTGCELRGYGLRVRRFAPGERDNNQVARYGLRVAGRGLKAGSRQRAESNERVFSVWVLVFRVQNEER